MQKILAILLLLIPCALCAQQHSIGLGIKAGFNFADVSNASQINANTRVGFHVGLLYSPSSKIFGSRTELVYSRHGYNYGSGSNTGSVNLDYVMLTQMLAINITKYVQIQVGAYTSYLLSANADSSHTSTGNAQYDQLLSFYNRFDYGYGGGLEIHPYKGILVGARYQVSLADLYKQPSSFGSGMPPSFIPNTSSIDLKNNVVQLFLGYRF